MKPRIVVFRIGWPDHASFDLRAQLIDRRAGGPGRERHSSVALADLFEWIERPAALAMLMDGAALLAPQVFAGWQSEILPVVRRRRSFWLQRRR